MPASPLKLYHFRAQLFRGELHEATLDAFFAGHGYRVARATRAEQRKGIDRWLLKGEQRHSVEYKADSTAARTGNAFVETVSVDTACKPGWAYTSQAAYLVYYIPPDGLVYLIRFPRLRRALARWVTSYEERVIANEGYQTHGLLVPLAEFERLAEAVFSI